MLGVSIESIVEGSRPGQLRYLRLTVQQPTRRRWSSLFSCPRSLRSLPHFSALEKLSITLDNSTQPPAPTAYWTELLRCILRSALSLASLQTLSIRWKETWQHETHRRPTGRARSCPALLSSSCQPATAESLGGAAAASVRSASHAAVPV